MVLALQAMAFVIFLPPWEGFDEPFHYGYVQDVRSGHLPNRSKLPLEIWQSVWMSPSSFVVQQNLPALRSYDQFFACLPACERSGPPPAGPGNYESHQAPLAYLILAPFEYLFEWLQIEHRLQLLRFVVVALAASLTIVGWFRFSRRLALPANIFRFGIFLIGCSQMYWATVAHVTNDWLAIGLISLLIPAMLLRRGTPQRCYEVCLFVLAGALTKAYFLPLLILLIPEIRVIFSLLLKQKLAILLTAILVLGWYGNNFVNGNLIGMQEMHREPSIAALAATAADISWSQEISSLLLSALWTGNSSFLTFSRAMLWAEAAWLAVGCIVFFAFTRVWR